MFSELRRLVKTLSHCWQSKSQKELLLIAIHAAKVFLCEFLIIVVLRKCILHSLNHVFGFSCLFSCESDHVNPPWDLLWS